MADTATAADHIGLDYRINLAKLADTIKGAKKQLAKFHKDLAGLSKMASITITVNDKAAKAKVKQFKNAIQATLNKAGELEIKEVAQPFGKTSGAVPRMTKDFDNLFTAMGRDEKRLGELNKVFNTVNRSIEKQSLAMTARGKNGERFYSTANREAMSLNHLKGTLVATSTGFKNVALEEQRAAASKAEAIAKTKALTAATKELNAANKAYMSRLNAGAKDIAAFGKAQAKILSTPIAPAVVSPSAELKKMGITSATTTAQFHKMNFEVADHAKIAKNTRLQIKELENSMARTGRATSQQAHQFNRLGKRLEHSEYQVRKQTSAMGDARRAQERWGAGFKYMMLSQTAWIASGAIIFSAISGITKSLQGFVDFNQGLVDAAAITQATASGYERMEAAAMSAFKNSTMGIKETTEALKILGQSGMDAVDSAIALETVYKVTTATGGGTTEVVKFLTTAINVWKLSAEDAARVGNVLGAALNYSKLEVADLGVSFNYAASMAKTIGMSIEELAATMAVMSNAGIKASTIGTGLRGVFAKLIKSSPSLEKELDKVELKFSDVSLTSHTLFESLETLSKAGYDLTNVFSGMTRREAASLNVMLEQGVERFNLMAEALKDTTAVEVMFERSMMGMKNQTILTGHQIQAVLIDMLKVSQPIVIGTAKSIQALVAALKDLSVALIGIGVALKIESMMMASEAAKAAAKGLAATAKSAGLLHVALNLLKAHPIITFLALLIGGLAAGKAIADKFVKSTEKVVGKFNMEIDSLRKLQVLMVDSNRTDEEKIRILADYAKDFPVLLQLMDNEQLSLKNILGLLKEEIKVRDEGKKSALGQRLEQLKLRLEFQKTAKAEFDLAKKTTLAGKVSGVLGFEKVVDPKLEEEIRLLEAVLNPQKFKIIRDTALKLTSDQKEALEKLRYDQATSLEQTQKDYVKGLEEFDITEQTKTDILNEQLKIRDEAGKKFREAKEKLGVIGRKKGEESEEHKAQKTITTQLKQEWEKRKLTYADLLDAINIITKKRNDEIIKINEDAAKKQDKIDNDALKRRVKAADDIGKKRASDLRKEMKLRGKLYAIQEELNKEFEEKQKEINPSDYARGILDGLKEVGKELKNEYKTWKDLTMNVAHSMSDTLSDVFFDSTTKQLKSAGDYWRAFTTSVKRMIADVAARWMMLQAFGEMGGKDGKGGWGLLGTIASVAVKAFTPTPTPIPTSHDGGLINTSSIKKMHNGGLASSESLRIVKDGEYYIKDSSTRSIGVAALNQANRTGQLPQSQPQQVVHKYYNYVYAIDSESMDLALRKRGSGAISDISLNANAYARGRRDPRAGRRY